MRKFKEEKTTQAAAIILSMNNGQMNYMKLIKLLYLIDRAALIKWGRPITYDKYVSMNNGPVLSQTYNLICENIAPDEESYWYSYITSPENYEVSLKENPSVSKLSDAEIELIKTIYEQYKDQDQWDMVKIVHDLPEWQDPEGSAIPIDIKDILRDSGKTDIEVEAILSELKHLEMMDMFLK